MFSRSNRLFGPSIGKKGGPHANYPEYPILWYTFFFLTFCPWGLGFDPYPPGWRLRPRRPRPECARGQDRRFGRQHLRPARGPSLYAY